MKRCDFNRFLRHSCVIFACLTANSAMCDVTEDVPVSEFMGESGVGELSLAGKSQFTIGAEVGRMESLETYLSPVTYSGPEYGVQVWQELPFGARPERLRMRFGGRAAMGSLLNPRGNARKYDFNATLSWGMERMWTLPYGLRLGAGGVAAIDGGVGYVPRNSNNPAAARASLGIEAAASALWVTRIGRFPLKVEERIAVPTLNLFFSPAYGETYYEIYLGNHSGLAHFGWWGNTLGVTNHLSATLKFGRRALRLGWYCRLQRQRACGLRTRLLTNALTVEFSTW